MAMAPAAAVVVAVALVAAAVVGGGAARRSTLPCEVSISDPTGMLRSRAPSRNGCLPGGVTVTVPDTRPMSIECPKLGGGSLAG